MKLTKIAGAAGLAALLMMTPPAPAEAGTVVVKTKAELLSALAAAQPGDTVFVDGAASIDLTGTKRIRIPDGVTLASNRGQSGALGGLLYNTELDREHASCGPNQSAEAWAQFNPGSRVRITGLRLRGPDTEIRGCAYQYDNSRGIQSSGVSDLLVDGNELWGWSHGAVYLGDTLEGRVRGNNIHHNRRSGLGYGVVLYGDTSAVIENNTFTQNRHAIAGQGIRTQRYDARFNLVVDNARSHGFDMHGENEALGNGAPYAGDVIHITNNSFRSSAEPAVKVRGRPQTGGWVSGNCFAHTSASGAVAQVHFSGNLHVGSNSYGTTSGNCHQTGRRIAWRFSSGGTSNWAPLAPYTFAASELGFGDFDGDGRTDAFRATGARWYYSPGAREQFVAGALSGDRLASLRFGDFDGDRKTDVFSRASTGQWRYSSGAVRSWQNLNSSSLPLTSLRFGDFDGDGRTDVFTATGGRWYYSAGGAGNWQGLATSGDALAGLRFGDLDGDGRTDVFKSSGGRWYFSSGGRAAWAPLALSGCPIGSLQLGDFDGDGKDDVFDGRC